MAETKYIHDTFYYGCDILHTITEVLGRYASFDRGGVYIWLVPTRDSEYIVFYDYNAYNCRGALEIHKDRNFLAHIDYEGILDLNDSKDDLIYNKNKVIEFLSNYKDGALLNHDYDYKYKDH